MHIVNLASGSKANSTFMEYGDTKILIDAGLSVKELENRLSQIDKHLSEISAVCITHEHSDHIKGLAVLAKNYNIDVYVHEKLLDCSAISGIKFKPNQLKTFTDKTFLIKDIEITPFAVSHDAVYPVGFVANVKGSASKVGFATDFGEVTDKALSALTGTKMVFIESNYDEDMLKNGFYPPVLKARIQGKFGHLSNEQSVELAGKLYKTGTKCFILSHLSQNNNLPQLAFTNYKTYFENNGSVLDKDVFVRLSFQNKHGNNFNLKEDFYE